MNCFLEDKHLKVTPTKKPWFVLASDTGFSTLPPRAKANSFGYQISSNEKNISEIKVGVSEKFSYSSKVSQSSKQSPPIKPLALFTNFYNPEDDWEEDTTDTEIMKNINSLLDSGKHLLS